MMSKTRLSRIALAVVCAGLFNVATPAEAADGATLSPTRSIIDLEVHVHGGEPSR